MSGHLGDIRHCGLPNFDGCFAFLNEIMPKLSTTGSPLQGGRRLLHREPGPELAGGAVRPRAADVQPQGALGAAVPRGPLLRHAHVLPVRIHAQVRKQYE